MTLTKATIEILEPDPGRLPQVIPVQFNPTDVLLKKSARFAEIALPGLDSPLLQFVHGEAETLDLELFCDTTKSGTAEHPEDVRKFTEPLRQLVKVQPGSKAPPRIRFGWGDGLSFTAVALGVEQKFTMFSPSGIPLRATVRLALREYRTLQEQLAMEKLEGGKRSPSKSETGAGNERSGSTNEPPGHDLPDLYTPSLVVLLDDKPLHDSNRRDIIQAIVRERLDEADEFELQINNWDSENAALKYDDTSRFDPGTKAKVQIGYSGSKHLTVTGQIETLTYGFSAGAPTLVARGRAARPRRPSQRKEALLTLSYGKTLVDLELQLARAPGGKDRFSAIGSTLGLPDLRAGSVLKIDGIGTRLSGQYKVTATAHSIGTGGYTTRFECQSGSD